VGGFLGAALGYGEQETTELLKYIKVSVVGLDVMQWGIAKDLWRYLKFKGKVLEDKDIVVRELLYTPKYYLYVSGKHETLEEIKNALSDPAWALSLGREDEMVLVKEIKPVRLLPSEDLVYENTILPFNVYETSFELEKDFLRANLRERSRLIPPSVHKLPTTFTITKKGREPEGYIEFSFIYNLRIRLKQLKPGYQPLTDGLHNIQLF